MRAPAEKIEVKVVEGTAELEQAKAIRAIVFVGEQRCPYAEEFDGNDSSAQHVICFVNGEPAATMRIRYFSGFAKWERYCVLPQFRRTSAKTELVNFALDLAKNKGFHRVYFQAEQRLANFWKGHGFSTIAGGRTTRFSDREYLEFEREIHPGAQPITIFSDPMVLNRVEGKWLQPGVLDRSIARSDARSLVTNP
ncbi:MAG: GNAT family N-acetyltransferase [Rhizomicrobium sp.]